VKHPAAGPWLALASTGAMVALHVTDSGGVLRVAATALFLALAPGLPLTPRLPRHEAVAYGVLVVAVSLCVDAAVATALLVAGVYDPDVALVLLTVVAATGALVALLRRARAGGEMVICLRAPAAPESSGRGRSRRA